MISREKFKKIAGYLLLGLLAAMVLIQLVPYGRDHANPVVVQEPPWSSPAARQLAVRACFDCHSNETRWPWYSQVAPVSWLVQRDVDEGRHKLNFSEWNRPQRKAEEAAEELREGRMPLWFYVPLHSEARLTQVEKQTLGDELQRFGGVKAGGQAGEEEGEEDED